MSKHEQGVMRHYYSDDGCLAYDFDDSHKEILFKLADALNTLNLNFYDQRWVVLNHAINLVYCYDLYHSLDKFDEWRNRAEEDVLCDVVKKLLFNFVDRGFLYKEFLLVANAAVSRLQIDTILSENSDL